MVVVMYCVHTLIYLPASCAQSTKDVTLELIVDAQLLNLPPASSPKVSYRAFTPQRRAVAQADDSPVWASTLYV